MQLRCYKQDLTTLFTIAKNDQDKTVQEAATAALAKLEQLPAEAPKAEQPANTKQVAKEVKMEQPKQTAQAA